MTEENENQKKEGEKFNNTAMSYVPKWAWACIGILIATSISIRQIGLDLTTPLNRIMTAYAVRIEKEQETCNESLDMSAINQRIELLEKCSNKPINKK